MTAAQLLKSPIPRAASIQSYARIAGLLYLVGSVAGVFGILYGPSLVVPGDAAATARHIQASASLFRLSIVSALLCQVIFIFVVLALYQLLKVVNQNMAALMVIFMLLSIPIAMLNKLNNVAILYRALFSKFARSWTGHQLSRWGVVLSHGVSGVHVRVPSQDSRCLVDHQRSCLSDKQFCCIPCPRPPRECCDVYRLGGGGIRPVAVDQRGQRRTMGKTCS